VERLVRRGGIVMLDNSKREKYAAARRAFDRMGWARVEFDSTPTLTLALALTLT